MKSRVLENLNDSKKWYAVYCKSRHERIVYKLLCGKGINGYLAEYETRVRWGKRLRKVKRNLLPGYVLVLFDAMDTHTYLNILQTQSVVKFVGNTWPNLSAIPHEQIENLKLLLNSKEHIQEVPFFNKGDYVEVVSGALAGLKGRILNYTNRNCRVIISIDLLQRSAAVDIDSRFLRAIKHQEVLV